MVYTSGYCIRIYYNPRNPEEKILRVTLRAADRIEAADREAGKGLRGRRAGGRFSSEEKIYRRNKSKMSFPPYEQRAKPTREELRIKRMRGGEEDEDPGRGGSLFLYGNLNFWA